PRTISLISRLGSPPERGSPRTATRWQVPAEEVGHAEVGVGAGRRVVAHGRAAALPGFVAIGHVRQERARLSDHVEIMVGAGIDDALRRGSARPHRGRHLRTDPGRRPVFAVTAEDQHGTDPLLVDQREATARTYT